jgi:hypothetical protein
VGIPRLNVAGRDYVLGDKAFKVQSVIVLTQVGNDLDCSFLHLQADPVPCIGQRVLKLSTIAIARKWLELVAIAQMEHYGRDDDDKEKFDH